MSGAEPVRTRRRWRAVRLAAATVMVALPVGAFVLAPAPHAHADDGTPGANLGGVNAASTATGIQISPLTPGIVGAGDVSQGDLVEAAAPYASSSTSTGPATQAIGAPVYPGATAANGGNALGTFAPQLPPALLNALNDSALAQADYPPQPTAGSTANYAPPTGSSAGLGTASASASDSGAQSSASTSSNAFPGSVFSFGSATTQSSTVLGASTVTATAETDVSGVSLLGGEIQIDGIKSTASAVSDGTNGTPTSSFGISSVTVAGQPASIGPNGITLTSQSQGAQLAPTANQVLAALQQAGIAVRTLSPSTTTNGSTASVDSGALAIEFFDSNIPSPGGENPVTAAGIDVYVGLSQASADATVLPPINFGDLGNLGSAGSSTDTGSSSDLGSATSSGDLSSPPTAAEPPTAILAPATAAPLGGPSATNGSGSSAPSSSSNGLSGLSPVAAVYGQPVRTSWVIIAVILSIVVAGPLLGYANWQLLRGRKS